MGGGGGKGEAGGSRYRQWREFSSPMAIYKFFIYIWGWIYMLCRLGSLSTAGTGAAEPFLCRSIRTLCVLWYFHRRLSEMLLVLGWWWRHSSVSRSAELNGAPLWYGNGPGWFSVHLFFHSIGDVIGGAWIKSYYLWKEFREKWPNETVFNGQKKGDFSTVEMVG